MGTIANIIDAIRRIGAPSQKSALRRQDQYLSGKAVLDRRIEIHRTEDGPVQAFVATTAPTPESIRAFDETELAAIGENAAQVSVLSARYLGFKLDAPTPKQLDEIFTAWTRSADRGLTSAEEIVQILGAAFGQYCCTLLKMRWVVVTDGDGSAAAIKGIARDFRGFPFHSIRKRIEESEHEFFAPIFISLQNQSLVAKETTDVAQHLAGADA